MINIGSLNFLNKPLTFAKLFLNPLFYIFTFLLAALAYISSIQCWWLCYYNSFSPSHPSPLLSSSWNNLRNYGSFVVLMLFQIAFSSWLIIGWQACWPYKASTNILMLTKLLWFCLILLILKYEAKNNPKYANYIIR